MTDVREITEFNLMAANGPPSCEEVLRLLETASSNREQFEEYLADVCKGWGLDLGEFEFSKDFACVYSDGSSVVKRAPNGNYLLQAEPVVTSYTND